MLDKTDKSISDCKKYAAILKNALENRRECRKILTLKTMIKDGKYEAPDDEKMDKTLLKIYETANDTRKFEIDLYWKRALYFWGFIAAIGLLYFQLLSSKDIQIIYRLLVSFLGTVFSWAWYLVNRGSKYWQENWEKAVSILEEVLGFSLFEVRFNELREKENGNKIKKSLALSGRRYSVSKINTLVALITFIVWTSLFISDLLDMIAVFTLLSLLNYTNLSSISILNKILLQSPFLSFIILYILFVFLLIIFSESKLLSKEEE